MLFVFVIEADEAQKCLVARGAVEGVEERELLRTVCWIDSAVEVDHDVSRSAAEPIMLCFDDALHKRQRKRGVRFAVDHVLQT